MVKLESYKPLGDKQFADFILKVKNEIIPPYVRISRLVRDVPATSIVAGPKISNIRQIIAHESKCQCIRCREVRADYNIKERIILDRIDYCASDGPASTRDERDSTRGGREIFLQFVSPDKKKLFALLRLRIPYSVCHPEQAERVEGSNLIRSLDRARDDKLHSIFPVLRNAAIVRELHTYGKLTPINKKDKKSPQHIGLGKRLMAEAERIAKEEFNFSKIAVIAGVGVKEYYRKLGYRQKDTYMVKNI
jgi:elongator complex protein 3